MGSRSVIPPPPAGFVPAPSAGVPPAPEGFSAPPPPSGFVPAQETTPSEPSIKDQVIDMVRNLPGVQEAIGAAKGVQRTAAGLADLASHEFLGSAPGEQPTLPSRVAAATIPLARATQSLPESVRAPLRQAATGTAEWLRQNTEPEGWRQHVGNIGETVAELMALPEADAELIGARAATHGDMLVEAGRLAKFIERNPKAGAMIRLGLNSLRAGAEQGTQTFARTEDPEAAAQAAAIGAAADVGVRSVAGAYRGVRGAVSRAAESSLPRSIEVAGADVPVSEAGNALRPPAGTADTATQAADEAIGNISKTGVLNSIRRTNAARPIERMPITDRARLLEAPEGSPTGFRVGTTEPTETVTQPSQEGRMALEDWQQQPEMETARPESVQFQPPVGGGTVERGGGGDLIFTADGQGLNVARARYMLNTYERLMQDPEAFNQLGIREQDGILRAMDDLGEQIRRYDDFAASQPHFPAIDEASAVANAHDLGSAGRFLQNTHGAFWRRADELTDGEFGTLDRQRRALSNSLHQGGIGDRFAKLDQLDEVTDKIDDLLDQHRTQISSPEWATAREGYQDGLVLEQLHNIVETGFNGITRAEGGAGLRRTFDPGQGFNSALERFYQKRGSVLERTIGRQHMTDIKQLGQLFEKTETREASRGLLDSIGSSIRRHYHGIRGAVYGATGAAGVGAALAGHSLAGALGVSYPLVIGTGSGIRNYIVDRIATDPEFAKRFIYAATNDVSPRIAGPLLASRLIATLANEPNRHPSRPQRQQQPAMSTGEQQ